MYEIFFVRIKLFLRWRDVLHRKTICKKLKGVFIFHNLTHICSSAESQTALGLYTEGQKCNYKVMSYVTRKHEI